MNIYLDIDDVIFQWHESYADRFKCRVPKTWSSSNLMKKRLNILSKEKEFWLNLKIKNIPNFQPKGFVSARSIPKAWTRESFNINQIPGRSNIHQVPWGHSKIELLKSLGCDIFIDDKYETFKDCMDNGIFCLLMNASHNQKIKTPYRINSLDYNVIMNLYNKWKTQLN
jgi:hypothetical protein